MGFSTVNLSHVSLVLRPARKTSECRGNFFLLNKDMNQNFPNSWRTKYQWGKWENIGIIIIDLIAPNQLLCPAVLTVHLLLISAPASHSVMPKKEDQTGPLVTMQGRVSLFGRAFLLGFHKGHLPVKTLDLNPILQFSLWWSGLFSSYWTNHGDL